MSEAEVIYTLEDGRLRSAETAPAKEAAYA
jgi:hypothetical protein